MKKMKKIFALLTTMMMVLGLSTSVFASEEYKTYEDGDGTITVNNAAAGEKYYAVKALGATVSEDGINYTGEIPDELAGVIEKKTENGYEFIDKKADVTDAQWQAAMREYANAHQAEWSPADGLECTGNSVTFTGLDLGYYVIISTYFDTEKGEDVNTNKVSAGSTFSDGAPHTPDGQVYEKNSKEVVVTKDADGDSYTIGDTVEYTVKFNGMNYYGEGEAAEIVKNYIVEDTLPEYLEDVEVTELTIGGTEQELSEDNFPGITTFGTNKTFTIPWATETDSVWTSKYANGTEIVITYTATLTDIVKIDGEAGNKNVIKIIPETPEGRKEPYEDHEEIFTYAAALKKTDGEKTLAGAKFKFKGLVLDTTADGIYTVVSYDPNAADFESATEVEVGEDGMLYILGLAEAVKLTGKETVAPKGFNLLTEEFELTPQVLRHEIWSEAGEKEFDAEGNLVSESSTTSETVLVDKTIDDLEPDALEIVNKAGSQLPSTGGIGTTIFYIIGAILVIGAGVVLVTRRRMSVK